MWTSRSLLVLCVVTATALSGCPTPVVDTPDAFAPRDAASGVDAHECTTAAECSNGLFCDGEETCTHGVCGHGPTGCDDHIACTTDRCDEAMRACTHRAPDLDMDGYGDAACVDSGGVPLGNDCADDDVNRFPGNHEICDPAGHDEDCDSATHGGTDADSDGYESSACCNPSPTAGHAPVCGADCDDARAATSPVGTETCDGLDQDCDMLVDEGTLLDGYEDLDFDGYGSTVVAHRCAASVAFTQVPGDCDDSNPSANPGLPELCDVGAPVDNNCDGSTTDAPSTASWYADHDGDGFGSAASGVTVSCLPIANASLRNTDCNDMRADINPAQAERCDGIDDNCNGLADYQIAPNNFEDDDMDGFIDIACAPLGNDCDDMNPASGPGNMESCDGRDNDCDGHIDEDAVSLVYYRDLDSDGYGSIASGTIVACMTSVGFVARAGDCNDADSSRYPTALERCNAADDDCDSAIDEAPAASACPMVAHGVASCSAGMCGVGSCASGYSDCNHNPSDGCEATGVGPGMSDGCDGIDNDCDGRVDEDAATSVFYRDIDGDGFGSASSGTLSACAARSGYVATAGDCNDADITRHPGATELCDGGDNDCDSAIDEAPATASCGTVPHAIGSCVSGTCGIASCTGSYADCNHDPSDGCEVAGAGAGVSDLCDGLDNDCDGRIDEDAVTRVYYRDMDRDMYGSTTSGTMIACAAPTGFVGSAGDCLDTDATRFPGAVEVCDAADNDCDGTIDEAPASNSCSLPHATSACVSGGACGIASCTGGFSDCNGIASDGCEAFGAGPGTPDGCDGVDNDCDGRFDEDATTTVFYRDVDMDTYGASTSGTVISCMAPPGYVSGASDCNDMDATRHPGALEVCDGGDNDCDSAIDEAPATASCGTLSHGTAGCLSGGRCGVASCNANYADCNADATDGCESALATDVFHCGSCATDCNGAPRVTGAVCSASRCTVTACAFGYEDCDAFAANGCETGTQSDPLHCGSCTNTCGVSQVCSAGTCALACAPGLIVCDGRCVNPQSDVSYCGASGACTGGQRGAVCRPGEACASGACFASFISPGIDAVSMTFPRTVSFTLDAPGAATIFYTLDGTVPGVSGSTVTASAPVTLAPLGESPTTIRWVAQFGGGGTETIVHQVAIGTATGYQSSLGEIPEFLNMNGEGPVIAVAPGTAVSGSVQVQLWRSDSGGYCPGCVLVPDIGVDGVGQVECPGAYGGGSYAGQTTTRSFSFTAPATPGRYYVRAGIGLVYTCADAGGGGGPIGVLYVR